LGRVGIPLASRGIRIAAFMIDVGVYLSACVPGFILAFAGNATGGAALTIIFMATLAAWQWHGIATTGQSLGKRCLGIRIVASGGAPCGFVRNIVLRFWLPAVVSYLFTVAIAMFPSTWSGLPIINPWLLIDCVAIAAPSRRCVHDLIAGTWVVSACGRRGS
jgi:uncharacterized RDD family membrane protein YckC